MERNLVTVSSLSFFFSFSFLVSKFCRNWQVFTFRCPFFKIVDPCKRILVGLTFRSSFNYEISRIFSKTVGELFFILPPIPAEIATFSFSSLVYALITFQLSVKFLSPLLFLLLFPRPTDRKNTSPPLVNQIQPLFELDPSLFFFFQGTRWLTRISINRPRDKKMTSHGIGSCDEQKFFSKQFTAVQNFSKIFDQKFLIEF